MNWKLATGIAFLMTAQAVQAGGSYVGRVRPDHWGALYLEVSATQMSNRPGCATRNTVRLQEAPTDAAYKEKFAMILAAWVSEKSLQLYGTGTCTVEGDEIISVVIIQ